MAHGISITQEEMEEIVRLERQYELIGEQLEDRKAKLLPLVLEKFPMEFGRFEAKAVKKIARSGLSYKQLVIDELGVEAAETYKRKFPTHVYFELEIVEHAVPPLWKSLFDNTSDQV